MSDIAYHPTTGQPYERQWIASVDEFPYRQLGSGTKDECDAIAAAQPNVRVDELEPPDGDYVLREDGCWHPIKAKGGR